MNNLEELIFATNNAHKVSELTDIIRDIEGDQLASPSYTKTTQKIVGTTRLLSLNDIGFHQEIEETGSTLHENAYIKAKTIFDFCHQPCLADDTGLEIEALNGEPGVYSARYAGENCNFEQNIKKVLTNMQNATNRKACFRTVICLITSENNVHYFEGRVDGVITEKPYGDRGFGYDAIFAPNGFDGLTFAEMSSYEKNKISHRANALNQFAKWVATASTPQQY
jgi:XTP/dITP diphosphohydrolase